MHHNSLINSANILDLQEFKSMAKEIMNDSEDCLLKKLLNSRWIQKLLKSSLNLRVYQI